MGDAVCVKQLEFVYRIARHVHKKRFSLHDKPDMYHISNLLEKSTQNTHFKGLYMPIAVVFIAYIAIIFIVNFNYTGNRNCPEIKRGSRVSRRVARVWACFSMTLSRSNTGFT